MKETKVLEKFPVSEGKLWVEVSVGEPFRTSRSFPFELGTNEKTIKYLERKKEIRFFNAHNDKYLIFVHSCKSNCNLIDL